VAHHMQDAHEHILVVGKVCHSLDILDMGVLTKLDGKTIEYELGMYFVCTDYLLGCTTIQSVQMSMY
jgi:hypothetical protein